MGVVFKFSLYLGIKTLGGHQWLAKLTFPFWDFSTTIFPFCGSCLRFVQKKQQTCCMVAAQSPTVTYEFVFNIFVEYYFTFARHSGRLHGIGGPRSVPSDDEIQLLFTALDEFTRLLETHAVRCVVVDLQQNVALLQRLSAILHLRTNLSHEDLTS